MLARRWRRSRSSVQSSAARVAASGAAASSSSSALNDANRRAPRAPSRSTAPSSSASRAAARASSTTAAHSSCSVGASAAGAPRRRRPSASGVRSSRGAPFCSASDCSARESAVSPSMPKGWSALPHLRASRSSRHAVAVSSAPHTTNWRSTLTVRCAESEPSVQAWCFVPMGKYNTSPRRSSRCSHSAAQTVQFFLPTSCTIKASITSACRPYECERGGVRYM